MKKIKIKNSGINIELDVKPLDNLTTKAIDPALPIKSEVERWGDEIYFEIGIEAPSKSATLDVNVGDIAYWSQGRCLCIFFGRTPENSLR